jgi:hypothetical protein
MGKTSIYLEDGLIASKSYTVATGSSGYLQILLRNRLLDGTCGRTAA